MDPQFLFSVLKNDKSTSVNPHVIYLGSLMLINPNSNFWTKEIRVFPVQIFKYTLNNFYAGLAGRTHIGNCSVISKNNKLNYSCKSLYAASLPKKET